MAITCDKIEVLDNGKFKTLDLLPETNIVPIRNLVELTEVDQLKINGAYATSVPITQTNKRCLDRLIPKVARNNSANPLTVRVWKGYKVLEQDSLYVISKSQDGCTYSIRLTQGNKHPLELAADCSLCDILPDTEGFDVSKQSILDNWLTNPSNEYNVGDHPALYLPINYGGFYRPNLGFTLEDLRPLFSLTHMLKEGFRKLGWCLKSPLLDTKYFRSMWMYILSEDFNSREDILDECRVILDLKGPINTIADPNHFLTDLHSNFYPISYNLGAGNTTIVSNSSALISFYQYDNGNTNDINYTYTDASYFDGSIAVDKNAEYCSCIKGNVTLPLGVSEAASRYLVFTLMSFDKVTGQMIELEQHRVETSELGVATPAGHVATIDICSESYINFVGRCLFWKIEQDTGNYFDYYQGGVGIAGSGRDDINIAIVEQPSYIFDTQIEFIPKRKLYGEGSRWEYNEVIDCDKSLLELFKGYIDMISGKLDINYSTREICVYPPKNVNVYGESVEGYCKEETVTIQELLQCDSGVVRNPQYDKNRCLVIGYANSNDDVIESSVVDGNNEQQGDYEVDRGSSFTEGKCDSKRNPFFQPTAVSQELLVGGYSHIPQMVDNDNGEISFNLGCRLVLAAPPTPRSSVLPDGLGLLSEVIRFCGDALDTFPLGYMDQDDLTNINLPAPYSEYDITYNTFYDLFKKWDVLKESNAPEICLRILLKCVSEFFSFDFRKAIILQVDGIPCIVRPTKLSLLDCSGNADLCVVPEPVPPSICIEEVEPDPICNNAPILICTESDGCLNLEIGGNEQATQSGVVYQIDEQQADGTYLDNWATVTPPLCNLNCPVRIRAIISYEDFEGTPCPDITTNYCFYDPCKNFPQIKVECYYNTNNIPCFKIIQIGTVTSDIDSIELTGCVNSGPDTSYNIDEEYCIEDMELFTLKSWKVNYDDDCKSTESSDTITKSWPPSGPEVVDCTIHEGLKPICLYDDNGCLTGFEIDGIVGAEIANILFQYQCDDLITNGWITHNQNDPPICCDKVYYRAVIFFCNSLCPIYCSPICETGDAGDDFDGILDV